MPIPISSLPKDFFFKLLLLLLKENFLFSFRFSSVPPDRRLTSWATQESNGTLASFFFFFRGGVLFFFFFFVVLWAALPSRFDWWRMKETDRQRRKVKRMEREWKKMKKGGRKNQSGRIISSWLCAHSLTRTGESKRKDDEEERKKKYFSPENYNPRKQLVYLNLVFTRLLLKSFFKMKTILDEDTMFEGGTWNFSIHYKYFFAHGSCFRESAKGVRTTLHLCKNPFAGRSACMTYSLPVEPWKNQEKSTQLFKKGNVTKWRKDFLVVVSLPKQERKGKIKPNR